MEASPPHKIACAPTPPAPRQCTPPRLAHSTRCTRLLPHSAARIHTRHTRCELLAATHLHSTLRNTCTFPHSEHNKRVMTFLDTAGAIHATRASRRFHYTLRASSALFRVRILDRKREWQRLVLPDALLLPHSLCSSLLARAGLSATTWSVRKQQQQQQQQQQQ